MILIMILLYRAHRDDSINDSIVSVNDSIVPGPWR
jgi:hypothetical protein